VLAIDPSHLFDHHAQELAVDPADQVTKKDKEPPKGE
jgi:hypothetical protein